MNYLTELLAFYRWLADSPVSPLLQAYWHLLMYTNNRAAIRTAEGVWYWPVAFKLPNTMAMPLLGLKDRRVLLRQRGYLINRGLVTYQKNVSQRAGLYRMVPFDKGLEAIWVRDERRDSVTQVWAQAVPLSADGLSPLININTNRLLYCIVIRRTRQISTASICFRRSVMRKRQKSKPVAPMMMWLPLTPCGQPERENKWREKSKTLKFMEGII